jgi:hypothetical protein
VSDDELSRDAEIASALDGIVVPAYELGFWARLEARLEDEGGATEVAPVLTPLDVAPLDVEPVELPAVVPMSVPRREQRRSVAVLAVAAAAILAVLVVRLTTDQPDELRVAGGTGGLQVAPDDGTTSPDAGPEQDGASRPGDDDGPSSEGEASEQVSDETTGAVPELRSTPTSSVRGGGESTATGPETASALAAPTTPEATFVTWAAAIDRGDVDAAAALTGPRTIRYFDALGADIEDVLTEAQEGWGAWADPDGRRIQPVELGKVDGERAVGLVLERPSSDSDDPDGRTYEGVPIVKGDDGWRVEFAAFDPAKDGRIEVIAPAPGPAGFEDLPRGGAIRIAAQETGDYYLNLDFSQSAHIPASDAVDGEIVWNPGGQKSAIVHLLVVAHLDEGQVVMLAQTFETSAG